MPTTPSLTLTEAIHIVRQNGDTLLALTTLEVLLDVICKINALDEDSHKIQAIAELSELIGPDATPARLN